jgi:hypothetical protein
MSATTTFQIPLHAPTSVWALYGSGDPASGAGVPAGIGSRFTDLASGATHHKASAPDTGWVLVSGAGTGGPTLPVPAEGDLLIGVGGAWVRLARPVSWPTVEYVLGIVAGYPAWRTLVAPPPNLGRDFSADFDLAFS